MRLPQHNTADRYVALLGAIALALSGWALAKTVSHGETIAALQEHREQEQAQWRAIKDIRDEQARIRERVARVEE